MNHSKFRAVVALYAAITTAFSPMIANAQSAFEMRIYKQGLRISGQPEPTAFQLELSESSLDFGGKVVGVPSHKTLTVTNSGSKAGSWSAVPSITGTNGFSISNNTCTGELAGRGSCSVDVQFTPTKVPAVSGQLTMTAGGVTKQVPLTGSGAGSEPLEILGPDKPLMVRQGETGQGTFTLANNTATPLVVGTLSVTGANAGLFTLAAAGCNGKTLQAGTSCSVTVTLAPGLSAPGALQANLSVPVSGLTQTQTIPASILERPYVVAGGGSEVIPSLDPSQLCYNLHASVYGGTKAQYSCNKGLGTRFTDNLVSCEACLIFLDGPSFSSRSMSFGAMAVGSTKTMQVLLENRSSSPITFDTPSLAVMSGPAANGQITTSCATLEPGQSCLVQATLSPTGPANFSARITLVTNAPGSPHYIAVSGNVEYQSATVGSFSVPAVAVGAAPVELTPPTSDSAGSWSYTSSNSSVATISGSTLTVVGGGTSTITATQAANGVYGPTSTTATLTVSAGDASIGTWAAMTKKVGDTFTLTPPTSNSTGAWSYVSSDPAGASVSGNTVTAIKTGTFTLTANQAATSSYKAGSASMTLTINKGIPTVGTWAPISVTTQTTTTQLTFPTSNSTGAWTAVSSNSAVATISGNTLTIVGPGSATITATQAATDDYQSSSAMTSLTVSSWYATSCQAYLQQFPTAQSGWYTLDVDGAGAANPTSYYCDMTSDGGGWTRIVRQTEAAPVSNWNGGVNGSSYALSNQYIPSHTQVGFGKDDSATTVDYVTWTYQTGAIPLGFVTSPKTGLQYSVHRQPNQFYSYHDHRSGLYTANGDVNGTWVNTLFLTKNSGGSGATAVGWAFAPNNETALRRGFRMQGTLTWTTSESYAWTVWVR